MSSRAYFGWTQPACVSMLHAAWAVEGDRCCTLGAAGPDFVILLHAARQRCEKGAHLWVLPACSTCGTQATSAEQHCHAQTRFAHAPAYPEGWGAPVWSLQHPPLMAHSVHNLGKLQAAPRPLACRQEPQHVRLPHQPFTPQNELEQRVGLPYENPSHLRVLLRSNRAKPSCPLACRLGPLPPWGCPIQVKGAPRQLGVQGGWMVKGAPEQRCVQGSTPKLWQAEQILQGPLST